MNSHDFACTWKGLLMLLLIVIVVALSAYHYKDAALDALDMGKIVRDNKTIELMKQLNPSSVLVIEFRKYGWPIPLPPPPPPPKPKPVPASKDSTK